MFSLAEFIANPRLWQSSRKCSLVALLLFESEPLKDSGEGTRIMLAKEKAQISNLFSECPLAGMSGDDIEKLRCRAEGGGLNKSADIYLFHGELKDPLHMIECKYRYVVAEGGLHGLRVRSIFEDLRRKFSDSRSFLIGQGREVGEDVWVVSNSNVASILEAEIVDLCEEAGVPPFNVVDNNGLHESLLRIGLLAERRDV